MGVAIDVKSLEEVPEIMREFVTEADGGFDYDFDKAFKALKEEREGRRADRKELASLYKLAQIRKRKRVSEQLSESLLFDQFIFPADQIAFF